MHFGADDKVAKISDCGAVAWQRCGWPSNAGMTICNPACATLKALGSIECEPFIYLVSASKSVTLDLTFEQRKTQWQPATDAKLIVVVPRKKSPDTSAARVDSESVLFSGLSPADCEIDDSFETFAVARVSASKLGGLKCEHKIQYRSVCVTTESDPPWNTIEESAAFNTPRDITAEERTDALALSFKDREMITMAMDWYGISIDASLAAEESPIDYVNRVARMSNKVAGYSWPSDAWPMGASGLYEAQTGHCGTFSLNMTYACRARGIPARCVTGAVIPSDLEGLDFHITSEIWVDELGWLFVDATCGGSHVDVSFAGWNNQATNGPGTWFGWHGMDSTVQDVEESRRLLGEAWGGGSADPKMSKEYWDKQFDIFDADGNGQLSVSEVMDALDSLETGTPAYNRAIQDANAEKARALSKIWDADGDGLVSRSEFVNAMDSVNRSSSGYDVTGYAGEMNNRASAGYGFHGANIYHADVGQPVQTEVAPSTLWVDFAKTHSGEDVSVSHQEASDPQKAHAMCWLRWSCHQL
jgi:hypothetical protein